MKNMNCNTGINTEQFLLTARKSKNGKLKTITIPLETIDTVLLDFNSIGIIYDNGQMLSTQVNKKGAERLYNLLTYLIVSAKEKYNNETRTVIER
ncbi:MAG TPA: hypothetical protein VNR61_10005 [Niallia sp.]|nr:hypothetical protein [Niallia sp.]